MSEAVIAALITGVLTLIGTVLTVNASRQSTLAEMAKKSEISDAKLEAKIDKQLAVMDTKIDELTREVRMHNDFASRIPVLEERLSDAHHRINELRDDAK